MSKLISLTDFRAMRLRRRYQQIIYNLLAPLMNSEQATAKGTSIIFKAAKAQISNLPKEKAEIIHWLWEIGKNSEELNLLMSDSTAHP